jgi:hypothetical protein
MPVPLHRKKLSSRGFNQAILLGEVISRRLEMPLDRHICGVFAGLSRRSIWLPVIAGQMLKEHLRFMTLNWWRDAGYSWWTMFLRPEARWTSAEGF